MAQKDCHVLSWTTSQSATLPHPTPPHPTPPHPTPPHLHLGAEDVHPPRVARGLLQQLAAGRRGRGARRELSKQSSPRSPAMSAGAGAPAHPPPTRLRRRAAAVDPDGGGHAVGAALDDRGVQKGGLQRALPGCVRLLAGAGCLMPAALARWPRRRRHATVRLAPGPLPCRSMVHRGRVCHPGGVRLHLRGGWVVPGSGAQPAAPPCCAAAAAAAWHRCRDLPIPPRPIPCSIRRPRARWPCTWSTTTGRACSCA